MKLFNSRILKIIVSRSLSRNVKKKLKKINTVTGVNILSGKQHEEEAICLKHINSIMNIKFEEWIIIELEKNVFLPQKYLSMTGDQIEALCKGNLYFQKIKRKNTYYTL